LIPTLDELKAEIENGQLAGECATYWSKVFADDFTDPPQDVGESNEAYQDRLLRWHARAARLQSRQGLLKSDAAFDIHRILSDPTKRPKANNLVSRGTFLSSIAPLCSVIASLPDVAFKAWSLVIQLAVGGDETVNLAQPSIIDLFNKAVTSNLITVEQRDAILNQGGTTTQSRLEELGWVGVDVEKIQLAKGVLINANVNS
jgi:hypothetical protein